MQARAIGKKNSSVTEKLKEAAALLTNEDRRQYPEWFRVEVVGALASGVGVGEVAKITGITDVTLRKWWRASQAQPALRELRVVEEASPEPAGTPVQLSVGAGVVVTFPAEAAAERIADIVALVARRLA